MHYMTQQKLYVGGVKTVRGVHYMTQQKLCVRGCENGQGGALYDTVMVIRM